jgi:hypothetical protein
MKINLPPQPISDWQDVADLQRRLSESCDRINQMANDVGMAKHIDTFDGDRRKQALARAMAASLAGGESAAKAEAIARASELYAKELAVLAREHGVAMQTIAEFEAVKLAWETARSILAMQRETAKML